MNADNFVRIKDSLATKLLRTVFSFYVVIAVAVTVAHMVIDYNYQKDNITKDLKNIQKTFEKGLSVNLWQLNQEALETAVKGMLEVPMIVGVKIQNEDGIEVVCGGIISRNDNVENLVLQVDIAGLSDQAAYNPINQSYQFELFEHSFPVHYVYENKSRYLGEVTLYSSSTVIYRRVKLGFLMLIVNAFVKTAALWFIFLFFATYLLRKPLAGFTRALRNISLDDLSSAKIEVETKNPNELKLLEQSFNDMINNLQLSVIKRENAENEIQKNKILLESSIESPKMAILSIDKHYNYMYFNQVHFNTMAAVYNQEIAVGKNIFECMTDQGDIEKSKRNFDKAMRGEQHVTVEQFGDIERSFYETRYNPIFDENKEIIGATAFAEDVTKRKLDDEQLKASVREKEILLQEIHHRVKNNMQVINALLKLQADFVDDESVKQTINDCQNRVYAMAAVHQTLYSSDKLSEIDFQLYLSNMIAAIFETYSSERERVVINTDVANATITLNQAYPLGLIINELLTNSLKYGFPDNREGEINVVFTKQDCKAQLVVADNGIGMGKVTDWKSCSSLGLKLVTTLAEDQLDGAIDLINDIGTRFIITFEVES